MHILLPPLQNIRTIVDRLRALTDVVAVRASHAGKLQISAATESAKVDVAWENLTNPRIGASPPPHTLGRSALTTRRR